MSSKKIIVTAIIIAISLTACKRRSPRPHVQKQQREIDISRKSVIFKRGISDGCATANGAYTKDHDAFNTNLEYRSGWFAGRRECESEPIVFRG
jgi:hypothetical protein